MTQRNPLVLVSGQMQELPSGDTVTGAAASSGVVTYVQQTQPVDPVGPWLWYQTDANNNILTAWSGP